LVGVDPVTISLLLAAASGAAGAMGDQIWSGLGALARRPFHRGGGKAPVLTGSTAPAGSTAESGAEEWAALAADPRDQAAAGRLAESLMAHASVDGEFSRALTAWSTVAWQEYPQVNIVHNQISDSTVYGPVIQAGRIDHMPRREEG
jgi:hypothetical protein